jgi:hypothetical protein
MLKKIITGTALVAVIGLVATAAYVVGTGTSPTDAPVVASAPSGPNEGITVHGAWNIEVADPDGTVVSVSDFENALLPQGGIRLAQVLGRTSGVGGWSITLSDPGGTPPCETAAGLANPCNIWEVPPSTAPNHFSGLAIQAPATGVPPAELTLSGSVTVTRDGSITSVHTGIGQCGPEVAAQDLASCTSPVTDAFSSKTLATADAVAVVAGQSVNVTVVFTFQ